MFFFFPKSFLIWDLCFVVLKVFTFFFLRSENFFFVFVCYFKIGKFSEKFKEPKFNAVFRDMFLRCLSTETHKGTCNALGACLVEGCRYWKSENEILSAIQQMLENDNSSLVLRQVKFRIYSAYFCLCVVIKQIFFSFFLFFFLN